jgi:hypothetical protein
MKTLMRYDLTFTSYNFPRLWAEILGDYLIGLTFYGHKLVVATTSVFFDQT